jgi:hypothetical protein
VPRKVPRTFWVSPHQRESSLAGKSDSILIQATINELKYSVLAMSAKPSGKKRARQAEFLSSFIGPRSRPSPHTLTRISFNEDGLEMKEHAIPVPTSSTPPTFKFLEPLVLGSDPIDNLSDGEGDGSEEGKVDDNKTDTTQVRTYSFTFSSIPLICNHPRRVRFFRHSWRSRVHSKGPF